MSSDQKEFVNGLIRQRLVHEVHTSERRSYRGCRRRWHWVFQDFYYPQVTAKPLEFGVAFHNAMEVLYNPETWKFDRTVLLNSAKQKFVETCEKQKKAYLDANGEQYLSNEETALDYKERVELGKGMLDYYWTKVAPKYDAGLKPLRVEIEFIVPIQNPDNGDYLFCKCKRCMKTIEEWWASQNKSQLPLYKELHEIGLPVCLAGRLDLLAEDQHGDYWIVDWKTTARLARGDASGQDRDEFLDLDDQIGSYVMALRRKLGLNVRGFIYVELKKAFPEAPQRNVNIRQGRAYSVNKQQAVDYETYLATVKEHDTEAYEAGLYDEFLTFLQNEGINFHGRYQVVKDDLELEEIERNLYMEAAEMTSPDLRIYPSAGRFSCSFCAFRQPCLEKNRQGDYQYMLDTLFEKRDKHYWVKELSTEKQGGE